MVDIAAPSVSLPHRSPGLTAIYNEIKGSRVNHVLDLGPSSARSFNFFAQLSCKIRFENLNELFLEDRPEALKGEALLAQMDQFIDDSRLNDHFDLVLTWDLFNYLDTGAIEWLMKKLSPLCKENALFHSIRYLSANIPDQPRAFQIVNQYQVLITQTSEPIPRHQSAHDTARLLKLMPDFYLENSYLNFDGMVPGLVENVFRFQPRKTLSGRRQSSEELAGAEMLYSNSNAPQAKESHVSSALHSVFAGLANVHQAAVLDLGQKTRQNLDVLYGITQNLYAENLYQQLQIQDKSGSQPQFKAHMLNFPEGTRFDLVLLWDVLNFLSPHSIEELFDRLRPWLHHSTVIHAVVYSGKEIPATPQSFLMKTCGDLEILQNVKKPAGDPLTSSRLLKLMKTFRLEETFVFRPGMQRGIYEYLFRPLPQRLDKAS